MQRIAIALLIGISFIGRAESACAIDEPSAGPPLNIVFMLIDDLGWKDLGCYGSGYYRTPHIDRLAAEGMLFTDGYAACNVCSPTRAAILTGKYPARLMLTQWLPSGRWSASQDMLREGRYLSNLPLEEVTFAEVLREAGYRTAFMGKWHLGTETYYYPEHQGFDVNVAGRDYGAPGSYFFPFEGSWEIPTTGKRLYKTSPLNGKPGDYLVDRLAEEAEKFIRASAERPFLLMLSHYAVHAPLQGKPELAGRFAAVDKDQRQGDPDYAAMVASVDQSVGRVLRTLRELDIDRHTLVIFTSDNGGFAKATDNAPLRNKGSNYEGGLRVPLIIKWPGQSQPGSTSAEPVVSTDFYPTILDAAKLDPRPYQHVDGRSLKAVVAGGKLDRTALYWHYPHYNQHPHSFPSSVVRAGDWKLIEHLETGQTELYDLASDIGETRDLSQEQPMRTKRIYDMLTAWRQQVGAEPMRPNPEFEPLADAFELVEKAVDDGQVPGAIAMVLRRGEVLRQAAYGLCDVESQRPMTEETICWLASITKPITVAAAMTLVEQGKLDLDDPIERYLPEFQRQRAADGRHYPVTIRQLMSHSSGIVTSVPTRPPLFFSQEWLERELAEIPPAIAATELDFAPGTQVNYSNAAPYILGRIIEICSGQDFDRYVQSTILDPLEMRDTYFALPKSVADRMAVVYRNSRGERSTFFRFDPAWTMNMTMPDGGLFAPPGDVAKFVEMFLRNEGSVLSRDSVAAMLTAQSAGWGLGWSLDADGSFSHTGSAGTLAWGDPKSGIVGLLFFQVQDSNTIEPLREQFRSALKF